MITHTRFFLIGLLAMFSACTTTAPPDASDATPALEQVTAPEPPPVPERAIPDNSLFPLLAAEFALRRQDFGTALQHYATQAPLLRDAAVSAHATRLAQFMRRDEQALEAAQLWTELAPENTEARKTLAVMLANRGDMQTSMTHMEALAKKGEDTPFAMLASDFEKLPKDEQTDLIARLSAIIEASPQSTQALLARAFMYEKQGKLPPALRDTQGVLTHDPDNQQAILLEAKLLQDSNAEQPFARLEQLLEQQPDNTRLRLHYARLLTRSDLMAARTQYEILSAQSPGSGELLLSLALVNRELKDDITARAYLKQMLALGTLKDQANFHLGWLEEDAGAPTKATGHYNAVSEGRMYIRAQRRHGRMLLRADQFKAFDTLFKQQRASHQWLGEQLYGLQTNLLITAGHNQRALAALSQALTAYASSTSLRYARAMLYERLNNLGAMESDLRQVLVHEPDNATALNALGYTLANRTDRLTEAADLVKRALTLSPDEPAILDSMGWVKYRQGDYAQALDYLKRAYSAFPDPEVAAHLGEVLWVSGQQDEAQRVWREALAKHNDHQILLETMQRLRNADNNQP